MRLTALAVLTLVVGGLVGCGADHEQPAHPSQPFAPGITDVTALLVLPDATVRVALRSSGTIEDVAADGNVKDVVAQVDVRADGQRGLLGVAVDPGGRTFAVVDSPRRPARRRPGRTGRATRGLGGTGKR